MKDFLLRALKWSAYPAFYFFCLVLFGFLTFPFDRLKDRLLAEIGKQSKGKGAPVITIDKMDSYWFSGAEIEGLKIRFPADEPASAAKGFGGGFGSGSGGFGAPAAPPAKDSVIEIKDAHVRARILPLIIGRVQLDFWASVFGGEVEGTAPAGAAKGDVELSIRDVMLSQVDPLQNLLGIPIDGKVNGDLSLSPTDGKFNKANGKLELSIKNIVVSDGKTKIQGLLAIPPAKVDEIAIAGEAEKGVLKITKLSANGPDLELDGDGKINVREPWAESSVDLYIKFRFTDAYRGKDNTTKSILGEPGSSAPPLIEMQVSKLKKAKRSDGFYGFHVHGKLKKLEFTPSATEVSGTSRKGKGGADSPAPATTGAGKKAGGVSLPLGVSSAIQNRDKDKDKEDEKREDPPPPPPAREEKKEEPVKEEERADDRPSAPGIPSQLRNMIPNMPTPVPPPPGNEEPPPINAPPGPGEEERPQEPMPEEQPR